MFAGRLVAVAIIVATVAVLQEVTGRLEALSTVALALGFALIAASLMGELAERVRLPRLTGYLLFGLLCGPYMLNLITATMARELQIVNGLAIALIAFIAGLEINVARLRIRLRAVMTIAAVLLGTMYLALGTIFFLIWPWLPIAPDVSLVERLAIVLVFTTVVVSFSPTVSIAVIAESRARGPLSELVLAMVVITDLVLILAFTPLMQFARWTISGISGDGVGVTAQLSWEIGGSLAFGALVGGLFAIYLRIVGRELTLMVLGLCVGLSAAGPVLHLEPLLMALAAGLVVENVAAARADALRDAVERSALPVLIVFFAAAGASLHVDALAVIGVAATLVALIRLLAIRLGARAGLKAAGVRDGTSHLMWMGLVSQAGVTLGLTILVAAEFPDWGVTMQTLIVAMIALHELTGPILFRAALGRAGEIGRMDEHAADAEAASDFVVPQASESTR